MAVRGVIQYRGAPHQKMRGFSRAVKAANIDSVEVWHEDVLPLHFTASASRKYRYQPRRGEGGRGGNKWHRTYTGRKQRYKGHTLPLVWSGQSRREMIRRIRITGTSKSVAGTMYPPRYFWMYRKDLKQPDKADEATRITREEARHLASVHRKSLTDGLNKHNPTATRKV